MCSAPLDLFSMLELGGQQPSNAMVAMNQLTTGGQHLKATVNRRRKKLSGVPNPKRMFEEVSCHKADVYYSFLCIAPKFRAKFGHDRKNPW